MKAAVYYGARDVRIEDVDIPTPGDGEVTVRVAHNGLCGSDLHEYLDGPLTIPVEPHVMTGAKLPLIIGHEFSGTIEAVGDGVTGIAEGDRVCVEPIHACGTCNACSAGHYNLCRTLAFHGLMSGHGGLSEVTVVTSSMVHRLPDEVDLELGAIVEPMAVAMHAARRGLAGIGDTAPIQTAVFGAGPIGIGLWFALSSLGEHDITFFETSQVRRDALTALGAPRVLDPADGDPIEVLLELSGGQGLPVTFDAAGVPATVEAGLAALAPHGRFMSVAAYPPQIPVIANLLLRNESTWTASLAYTSRDFEGVIAQMAQGRYRTDGWVTHLALNRLSEAFETLAAQQAQKILIDVAH